MPTLPSLRLYNRKGKKGRTCEFLEPPGIY